MMKFYSLSILLFLLPLLITAEPRKTLGETNPSSTIKPEILGGYEQIKNVSDPLIQSFGKFAVDEYNKEKKTHLKFLKVIDGKYQIVSGTNYDLRLTAIDGFVQRLYGALVYKNLQQKLRLDDFFGITRN